MFLKKRCVKGMFFFCMPVVNMQGYSRHVGKATSSVLAFLEKTYWGIAETLPHECLSLTT